MLMTGVEINPNADEFQNWYLRFRSMPGSVIPQTQAEINGILNIHLEDHTRTGRKKAGPLYATERLRDLYIHLQNKLIAERSKLRLSQNNELAKPVRSHKQITTVRETIEVNLGMIEDAFGLPFQSEDSMTAINFVNAQIEAEESIIPFASEAERMGFTRSLHELKLEYETKGKLDLGQTFDKLTRAFRVREETIHEDDTIQSAFTAQIQPQRKFGQPRNDNVKRSSPPSRDRHSKHTELNENIDYAKILKVIYDLKADVGTIKKGLESKGILVDSAPDHKRDGKGYPQTDRHRPKFAGIAKKTKLDKIKATRSLVQNREVEMTDSDEEQEEEEQAQLAMIVPVVKKTLTNFRGRNAYLSSIMRFDHVDLQKESLNPLSQHTMDGQINDAEMKDTTSPALLQEQSPQVSIQDSVDGDPVQEHLRHLSFQSPEMDLQMEYGDDVEQPESTDDNEQDLTPLPGRTRSARAFQSRSQRIVIPPAVIPDDSEDLDSDDNPSSVTKARPKNKYEKRVLRLAGAKKRVSRRGY
jgi:hypothetical protein